MPQSFIDRLVNIIEQERNAIDEMQKLAAYHHELVSAMKELADEFSEHTRRMSLMSDRFSKRVEETIEESGEEGNAEIVRLPVADNFEIPQALKGGPIRRGDK